jgi:long-chain acyl-CoA synthetase
MIAESTKPGAMYEIKTETIRGVDYRVFANAPKNLREVYASSLDESSFYAQRLKEWYPDDDWTFLVFEDETYTFTEAYKIAAGFSKQLTAEFNVKKGDRVAIAMRNYPEYCFAFMAITAIGALAVPMNSWWQGEELAYGIRDCNPCLILADQQRMDRLLPHISDLKIPILVTRPEKSLPENIQPLSDYLFKEKQDAFPDTEIQPDDDAYIMYTSGSTGKPKGVVATHRAVISSLMSWQLPIVGPVMTFPDRAEQLRPPFRMSTLLSVPLFHVSGCLGGFLVAFQIRMKTVMVYKWNAEAALQLIEQERITRVGGPPVMTWELVNSPEFDKTDTSSLSALGGGGAERPPKHLKVLEDRMGRHIATTNYGLTETSALGAINGGENYLRKPASVGKPTPPLMEVRITDESGSELPVGQLGEICLKSAANFRCYWKNEAATARAMLEGGWFRTGDMGYIDEDGDIFITDRLKEIVIRGGENISCREVEFAIYEHPDVLEAAVFGLPDPKMGEKLATVVYAKPERKLTGDALRTFLKGKLAGFKIPETIQMESASLPRLGSGKISKRQIRKDMLDQLEDDQAV